MVGTLTLVILGLPLLTAVGLAVAPRFVPERAAYVLAPVTTSLVALIALVLLPHVGESAVIVGIEWFPGAGSMGLVLDVASLCVILAISVSGFFVFLYALADDVRPKPLSWALMLLAWGAANAAFLANHFLGRYVALEIVALCVALLPLVPFRDSAAGIRMSSAIYLLLRLGDAGLLVAILELEAVSGTLFITPALQAGEALRGAPLQVMVVGFVLAVWVKLGGWPFHLWVQAGRRLALAPRLWLYATVVPSLGAYLLYRVTPLLVVSDALQTTVLWMGACSALLAALILTQTNQDRMLAWAGALQSGLILCVAAAGVKYAVWFGLLVLMPVRLLLFLSIDLAKRSRLPWRRVAVALFVLGGLALVALDMLHIWWAGEGDVSSAALFVAEMAVGVMVLWVVRMAWQLWHLEPALQSSDGAAKSRVMRWMAVGGLAAGVLVGGGMFKPLTHNLSRAVDVTLPLPSSWGALWLPSLALAGLALLLGGILGLILGWQRNRWGRVRSPAAVSTRDSPWGLQKGVLKIAQMLHNVVEVDTLEWLLRFVTQTVAKGVKFVGFVEHECLDKWLLGSVAQTVSNGVEAIRFMERECLDQVIHQSVRAVVRAVRIVQRWHTGKLRYNLLWLPAALLLATFLLIIMGG